MYYTNATNILRRMTIKAFPAGFCEYGGGFGGYNCEYGGGKIVNMGVGCYEYGGGGVCPLSIYFARLFHPHNHTNNCGSTLCSIYYKVIV